MARILILGGTGWLGREITTAALDQGDEVVCLARGSSGEAPSGARLVRADRRDPRAYREVLGDWDEVIEIAYEPHLVTSALDALAERAAHWTLVSSVSVYARNDEPHADESADLVNSTDLAEYAAAKVAAERSTKARLGDRLLIARPGLIVGPGDPTDRFGYWAARLRRGGPVLAPTTAGRYVQVIDVGDLAQWIAAAGRHKQVGTINAVGDAVAMNTFFDTARAAAGFDGEWVTATDHQLLEHDVRYWAGPRSLPLWLPLDDAAFAQRDGSAYVATGGTRRPLSETLHRTLDDEIARGIDRPRRSGLTQAQESAVLAAVR